ncbi:helix-turn-helix domain-containing protein [Oceanobacillus halotolerans]|uniref:helix-turn-helix domain-containing protein n=1 Tax=Oceanobacillus halotolerans TaxID=2663380 RepID=UPI0013DD7CD0|nr:helix-turn-helix transcriptional regulator [Oceanobacillus halotolerans]
MENKEIKKEKIKQLVGEEIVIARKSMLKTQEEFSEMIDLDVKQLGQLELGYSLPSFMTQVHLRKAAGLSMDQLIDNLIPYLEDDKN